jgi:hypothetical protein
VLWFVVAIGAVVDGAAVVDGSSPTVGDGAVVGGGLGCVGGGAAVIGGGPSPVVDGGAAAGGGWVDVVAEPEVVGESVLSDTGVVVVRANLGVVGLLNVVAVVPVLVVVAWAGGVVALVLFVVAVERSLGDGPKTVVMMMIGVNDRTETPLLTTEVAGAPGVLLAAGWAAARAPRLDDVGTRVPIAVVDPLPVAVGGPSPAMPLSADGRTARRMTAALTIVTARAANIEAAHGSLGRTPGSSKVRSSPGRRAAAVATVTGPSQPAAGTTPSPAVTATNRLVTQSSVPNRGEADPMAGIAPGSGASAPSVGCRPARPDSWSSSLSPDGSTGLCNPITSACPASRDHQGRAGRRPPPPWRTRHKNTSPPTPPRSSSPYNRNDTNFLRPNHRGNS